MTHSTPVTQFPGEAPRTIPLRTLFDLLPGNLQIMVFAYPLVAVGAAIWFAISPSKYSGPVIIVVAMVAPIYAAMIFLFRHKLRSYQHTVANVDRNESGGGEFGGCKVLYYRYQLDGKSYEDNHMTLDPKGVQIGDPIWILVNPAKPSQSFPWLCKDTEKVTRIGDR